MYLPEYVRVWWAWQRRSRSLEERAEAAKRQLHLMRGGLIAFYVVLLGHSWLVRDYVAGAGQVLLLGVICTFWWTHPFAVERRMLYREISFLRAILMDILATHAGGVAPVVHTEGKCALCDQEAHELAPAFKCVSGHLVHIACLVTEPDHAPRCPLCLRSRG